MVAEETCNESNAGGDMFSSEKKPCTKTTGLGVGVQSQVIIRDRNTTASELTVGGVIVFDTSDDEVESIWIGMIMSNPEWQGQGIYKDDSRQNISFGGVPVGYGEVALYVMWYEKINVMSVS